MAGKLAARITTGETAAAVQSPDAAAPAAAPAASAAPPPVSSSPSAAPSAPAPAPNRLRGILEDALLKPHTLAYRRTMRVILALILISVLALVVETSDEVYHTFQTFFDTLEFVVLIAFTFEYAAHLYVAENKWKYVFSWWGLIDLLAILPAYLALFHIEGLTFLRELRILRVLRMLKLMKIATDRAQESSAQAGKRRNTFGLDIQIYFICLFTVVVISSTLVFHAEHTAPNSLFTSIPAAMWWSIVTVTTTGYGDMVPATLVGRLVAAATMLSGLALFSLLTSVVGRVLMVSLFGAGDTDVSAPTRATAETEVVPSLSRQGRFSWLPRLLYRAFGDQKSELYHAIHTTLTALIFVSVGLVVLETVPAIHTKYVVAFDVLEYIIVAAFTVEYLAYVYLSRHRARYMLSFWGIVDLAAVLPTYVGLLALVVPLNLTALKIVRMLRVLRMLRTLKLSKGAVANAQQTVRRRTNTLTIDLQIYFIALFTAVVLLSSLVYYAEQDVKDTLFASIPDAMWWTIVTITTTGYGDMVPATVAGRVVGGVTMLTGLALFGILTSVVGRAMMSSLFGASDAEADSAMTGGITATTSAIASMEHAPLERTPMVENLLLENERLRQEVAHLRAAAGLDGTEPS